MVAALTDAERSMLLGELDRARHGFGLDGARGAEVTERTPSCGDEVTVRVESVDGHVTSFAWEGHGCTISMAAASALAVVIVDLSRAEFFALAESYGRSLAPGGEGLDGDLAPFAGVGRFPLRAGCASLAWRATLAALGE